MNTPLIQRFLVGSAILGLTGVVFFVPIHVPEDRDRQPPRPTFSKEAQEWLFRQRAYPTGTIPAGAVERAWRDSMDAIAPPTQQPDTPADYWTNIGPAPVLGGQIEPPVQPDPRVTGRVLDIAVHNNHAGHWFVATAGGIWETTNSGDSWTAKTDAVLSLGTFTVALAQSNPQILFAATHDNSGMGVALLKSIDGGTNWTTTPEFSSQSGLFFETVEVDPNDPANVMVVTSNNGQTGGVFKSTNGGTTFGPPRLPGNGTHLAINPTSFLQQYAGVRSTSSNTDTRNGVWRSTDGGNNWAKINGPWDQSISYAGGRVKIALSPTPPAIVDVDKDTPNTPTAYVVLATSPQPSPAPPIPGGIWKSEDPWAKTPNWIQLPTVPGGFDTPDAVMVDPTDSRVLYVGGLGGGFYRYDPTQTPDWKPVLPSTHVDQHAMAVEGSKLLLGNDGGFWTSIDRGNTWTHKNTNLSTIQFYAGSFHPSNALQALGGSQDNGTEWWNGNLAWDFKYYGDGGYSAFSTTAPDTWLVSAQGLQYIVKITGGTQQTWGLGEIDPSYAAFIAPIKRAPHSNVVVAGSNNMWKSTNFFAPGTTPHWFSNGPEMGNSWWNQIGAIAFAPSDPCSLTYAYGTGDGELRLTVSGGTEAGAGAEAGGETPDVVGPWKNLDPFGDVPGRYVKAIAFHPTNAAIIYVALSGFDANTGHVYKTLNGLDPQPRWSNVSPHRPGYPPVDIPFNALAIDPANPNIIYAGAELGVWKSTNGGALNSWTFMGPASGMPNVPVFDLVFNPVDGHLFAFTYGRGAFKLNASAVYPSAAKVVNLSTRLDVGTGDNVMIGGFIITGPTCSTKKIALRGLGPSTGLSGHLADPYLELRGPNGNILASNDNWATPPNSDIPQYLQPGDYRESVITAALPPGAYTVILTGTNFTTGIGLFEAYDLESASPAKMANISTRGFVQTGDGVMIGGMILTGANGATSRVVMRGMGPSIPLGGTLPNPLLKLKDENGVTLVTNDDWRDAPNFQEIENLGFRPGNDLESVILTTLAPGAYTVILEDAKGETGIGLFEAYPLAN